MLKNNHELVAEIFLKKKKQIRKKNMETNKLKNMNESGNENNI